MSEKEKKSVSFQMDLIFFNAIESYCKKVNMSKSSYFKKLVGDDLIEKGYLKKGGVHQ